MGYDTLKIVNFRGVKNLSIKDINQINLLVGRNNCGKTTVLEAIFLLSGMSNPKLALNIHNFRNLLLTIDNDWGFLFNKLNFNDSINISGYLNNQNRNLTIQPSFSSHDITLQNDPHKSKDNNKNFQVSTDSSLSINGLIFTFEYNNNVYSSKISLQDNNISPSPDYKELLKCSFLNPSTIFHDIDRKLDDLVISKMIPTLIDTIKDIDPNLINISLGTGGMVYADVGHENMLPINLMGDGLRRILAIVATIYNLKDGLLLIDEIDNGFHYSSLIILWKAVISACSHNNVQLIATTHSAENISALCKAYDELNDIKDFIRLIRIDKSNNSHKAFSQNVDTIKSGLDSRIEIR